VESRIENATYPKVRAKGAQVLAALIRQPAKSAAILAAMLVYALAIPVGALAQQLNAQFGEDLRPIYATAQDIAAGKRLADGQCVRCHGENGLSSTEGVPNLAAQRPLYLFRQLRAYQEGGGDAGHSEVQFMNPEALIAAAAYYSSLDPAAPKPAPAPPSRDPVQAGKAATAACAGCHGETGISKTPGIPSLVGLDPQYLVASMNAYKSGDRKSDIMKTIVGTVGESDLNNIALFYAAQKPARAGTPSPGEQAAGKQTAGASCSSCHGATGTSSNPSVPSLAGQDAAYLVAALRDYKGGARNNTTMKGLASSLSDDAQTDLAAFYANQTPQSPNVREPLTPAEWAERCDRCHGTNGNSVDPRVPALASQRVEYFKKVLHAYRNGTRRSPEMEAMVATLSEADIDNLANYYSRQQARGVVFVGVPAR
jgi:cytochrome c553